MFDSRKGGDNLREPWYPILLSKLQNRPRIVSNVTLNVGATFNSNHSSLNPKSYYKKGRSQCSGWDNDRDQWLFWYLPTSQTAWI